MVGCVGNISHLRHRWSGNIQGQTRKFIKRTGNGNIASGESFVEIVGRHSWSYWKPCFLMFHPRTFWEWCWKFAIIVLESSGVLVRWGHALLWMRLVIRTAYVCWLKLKKWDSFTYCWKGIRRNPRFSRSTCTSLKWTQAPAHPPPPQITWMQPMNHLNFAASAPIAIK